MTINDLPDHVLLRAFEYLGGSQSTRWQINTLILVSRRWKSLAQVSLPYVMNLVQVQSVMLLSSACRCSWTICGSQSAGTCGRYWHRLLPLAPNPARVDRRHTGVCASTGAAVCSTRAC